MFNWKGFENRTPKDMSINELETFIEKNGDEMTLRFFCVLKDEITYKKFLNRIRNATKL